MFARHTAVLLVATLLAAPAALATTHVRVRVSSHAAATPAPPVPLTETAGSLDFVIGNWVPLDPAQYKLRACAPQTWNVTRENVASLALRFSSVNIASDDELVVSAANGSSPQVINNSTLSTLPIPGTALKLAFRPSAKGCAVTGNVPTFSLTALGFEWTSDKLVTKESVCGTNTFKDAKCFAESHKTVYSKARAVVRTVFASGNKSALCTAWLWGNKGHIVTNNHCFSSQDRVDTARFEFLMETASCGGPKCSGRACPIAKTLVAKDNVKFIASDARLDYALLQITTDASAYVKEFGYLTLRDGKPRVGEKIYIPQHPGGQPKKIALTDDDDDAKAATITGLNKVVHGANNVTLTGLVSYRADTLGGSSGSPVILRASHLVTALHHHGGCNITGNKGTPSHLLRAPFTKLVQDNDGFAKADSDDSDDSDSDSDSDDSK